MKYCCKSDCYKSSHSPLVMSIIWLPSVRAFPWVRTFGRSKVWKMKHLHIMTDSWNNMNIYTHWHGTTKLPIQLFMRCVQACHSSWLLSIEQLCGSMRQSTHTRPRFAPFCISADSMPQLLQNDAKAAKADFTPALLEGLQQYTALTTSFTGWVSHTHRSASPLLLHEARGVFLPTLKSLKDSWKLRPQAQSLRALYSLYRFVHAANTPFFSTKVVFPRKWGQLQSSKQLSADTVDLACPLATVCCRKWKYFAIVASLNQHWQEWIHKIQHETAEYKCCREKLRDISWGKGMWTGTKWKRCGSPTQENHPGRGIHHSEVRNLTHILRVFTVLGFFLPGIFFFIEQNSAEKYYS